ncbi:MAG: hypothetical protein WCP68_03585 [Enhydrobacter sp.]
MFKQTAPSRRTVTRLVRLAEDRLTTQSNRNHRPSGSGKRFDATLIGPLPIHQLRSDKPLDDISVARDSARTGVRFLLLDGNAPVATIDELELRKGRGSKPDTLAMFNGEAAARRLLVGLEYIHGIGRAEKWRKGAHELRVLRLPGLHASALWISRKRRGFLLLRIGGRDLRASQFSLISEKELVERLLPTKDNGES